MKSSKSSSKSSFSAASGKVLEEEERFKKDKEEIRTGVETEYFLIDNLQQLEDIEKRNDLIEKLGFCKKELGSDSVEIPTEPVKLKSLRQLEEKITEREAKLVEEADSQDLNVLRSGTNPFRGLDNLKLSNKPSFKKINRYYRKDGSERLGTLNEVNVGDSRAVSLISAIHTNIEASSFSDAVDKANYIYMISPYISALSGNARFIELKDTGLSDLRMMLWERSHSSEEIQIGRLDSYYSSMTDYLERVREWPAIVDFEEDILENKVSRFWKDSRIKIENDDLIVESRIASTQPSIQEDVAVHAFCIGRVLYAQSTKEEFLDIDKVNFNRNEAMRNGLKGEMYGPDGNLEDAGVLMLQEIEKARKGLEEHGVEGLELLEILEERARAGQTPSDTVAEKYSEERETMDDRKALFSALRITN